MKEYGTMITRGRSRKKAIKQERQRTAQGWRNILMKLKKGSLERPLTFF